MDESRLRDLLAGVADGTVCNRGEEPVRFSRLFKASEQSHGLSADAVLMSLPPMAKWM